MEEAKKRELIIYILIAVACLFAGTLMLLCNRQYIPAEFEDEEEQEDYKKERFDIMPINNNANIPNNKATDNLSNLSTFCNCGGGIIKANCAEPASRVDSYHNGLTEQSKFAAKNWESNKMPYDSFISQPNYEQQNTNWFDPMPYNIQTLKNNLK